MSNCISLILATSSGVTTTTSGQMSTTSVTEGTTKGKIHIAMYLHPTLICFSSDESILDA